MEVVIKNGKFTITGDIDPDPPLSKSGKSYLVATTNGFTVVAVDEIGQQYVIALNIIVKKDKR